MGSREIKEKTVLGGLVSNMFTGEEPHVPTILKWFTKVSLPFRV